MQDDTLAPRSPRGGRPTRAVAERLAPHILDAALAVLTEAGPDGVTMDEVAHRARVSKKTLYGRFESKDELLAALVDHIFDTHMWTGGRACAADPGDDEPLRDHLRRCIRSVLRGTFRPEMQAVERLLASHPGLGTHPRVLASEQVPVRLIHDLLVAAQGRGEVEAADPSAAAVLLLDALVLGTRLRFGKLPPEEQTDAWVDAAFDAGFEVAWQGLARR